jgi:hypothetical protein
MPGTLLRGIALTLAFVLELVMVAIAARFALGLVGGADPVDQRV